MIHQASRYIHEALSIAAMHHALRGTTLLTGLATCPKVSVSCPMIRQSQQIQHMMPAQQLVAVIVKYYLQVCKSKVSL